MEKETIKNKIWKGLKWTIGIIVISYIILVIVRMVQISDKENTDLKVKEIHSIRLTMSDVDGSKLPPVPDEATKDLTVEGIDFNKNYVRDDVERFIFEKYTDIKERAAWMQWARARQMVMLKADSKPTLKAIMEEGDRADSCLLDIYAKPESGVKLEDYDAMSKEIDNMVWNTKIRIAAKDKGYENMTSYGTSRDKSCDL